jgi:flavin reductase
MNSMPHFTASDTATPGIDAATFRNAMSRLGAAVNIITTDGPGGKAGFAASAVTSVTDTPPTLLVCLNRSASVFPAFSRNQAVCVNTLRAGQEALSGLFGGKTPVEERFAAARWTTGASGAPILEGAIVSFDCIVANSVDVGTHQVLFCSVLEAREGGDDPALIYFRRGYHTVGQADAASGG